MLACCVHLAIALCPLRGPASHFENHCPAIVSCSCFVPGTVCSASDWNYFIQQKNVNIVSYSTDEDEDEEDDEDFEDDDEWED